MFVLFSSAGRGRRGRSGWLAGVGLLFLWLVSAGIASAAAGPTFDVGCPVLTEVWVDPVHGSDEATGATRGEALRSITAAWQRVPVLPATSGTRIQLVGGDYPENLFPGYWEGKHGSQAFPIIIQSADGAGTARLQGYMNFFDISYLYLIGLDIRNGGDVLHCERCDHFLIRNSTLTGGLRQAHETVKMNQCQYIYIEDSDIGQAYENAIDFVAVQYGHIVRNRIHDGDDWCIYLKGGSAYFTIEGNRIHHCGTGGFTAGQGTGFEYMVPPWLHYEAYALRVVNNLIYETEGAGLGVNGGYDILMAFNTLYRVGRRSHLLEFVFGSRSCDGDADLPSFCADHLALGGWGTTQTGYEGQPIPNRNVYFVNNVIYNPPGYQSRWQHFAIYGPRLPSPGSHIPSPAVTDDNLRIQGNLIWNGPADHPLGLGEESGCQAANPACNASQLLADNRINAVMPSFLDPEDGDLRPAPNSSLFDLPPLVIPDLPSWDDFTPAVPANPPAAAVSTDIEGVLRTFASAIGAYARAVVPAELPLLDEFSLTYEGSFLVPSGDGRDRPLTWGGHALGYDPARQGLFFGCHDHNQLLAEIGIPELGYPPETASILQDCADVTEGRLSRVDDYLPRLGGTLLYNGRLIVSAYGYYDADYNQTLSHFSSSPLLSRAGDVAGPFKVGAQAGMVAGYMTTIPEEWRSAFRGPALTGQCCLSIIGRSSAGPAVSVFNPDDVGTVDPVPAVTALAYPLEHPLAEVEAQNDSFNLTTQIAGIAFPPGTRSVLFIGRHGAGPYCYDTAEACGDPADPYKGPHAYPYFHQVWAYDALDLLAVIDGEKLPWEVQPYGIWRLPGMDSSGSASISGAVFDPASGRLYVTEAYGEDPVVHVFSLQPQSGVILLSAVPARPRFGENVTLTATVAGAGAVTFKDGTAVLGTGEISGGKAVYIASGLAVGPHSLSAVHAGGASNVVVMEVIRSEQLTLSVTATPSSLFSGGSGSILSTSGGSGTGAVSFAATPSKGLTCTITGSVLTAAGGSGTCRVAATKAGDVNYQAKTSAPLTVLVSRSPTSIALDSSLNPSAKGQSVVFTATVSGVLPSGTITFKDGSTTLGLRALTGGKATLSTVGLRVGTHRITVSYGGDTNNAACTSATLNQVVTKAATAVTLTSTPNPSRSRKTVIFTAIVTGSSPSGTVTFKDGTKTLGSRALTNGKATLSTTGLSLGTHSITANYGGDANNLAGTSATLKQVVQ